MATYAKINDFIQNLGTNSFATFNASATLEIALSNTAPGSETSDPRANTNGVLANVTQIAYTNYTDSLTTDRQLESVTWTTAGAAGTPTTTFDAADFTITASGGAIATWQYLYLFDQATTSPVDALISVWDHGSAISLADGETANINFNASGILTIS